MVPKKQFVSEGRIRSNLENLHGRYSLHPFYIQHKIAKILHALEFPVNSHQRYLYMQFTILKPLLSLISSYKKTLPKLTCFSERAFYMI
jgi:hypothetical protein